MNDIKETAKEIRTVLKSAFPVTKFSVKCHQFSQGEAVAISWTDGPAKDQVDPLVKGYGDGYSRYIRMSRRQSAVNAPGDVANWVESCTLSAPESTKAVAEAVPQPQDPAILVNDQLAELVVLQELLISKVEEVNQLKLKIAELQVEKDVINHKQRQLEIQKAPMFKIELTCTEGAGEKDGTVTAYSWDEAEFIIRRWARAVPINYTVYHLVDIVVYFHDGQSFASPNFQIKQAYVARVDLAKLIKNALLFLAGELPGEYSIERYKTILRRENIDTAKYKRLLDGWDFPA